MASQTEIARLYRLYRTSDDPGIAELAEIHAQATAFGGRVEAYLAAHPPTCSCVCCALIRAQAEGEDRPTLRDQLVTLRGNLWAAEASLNSERPVRPDNLTDAPNGE